MGVDNLRKEVIDIVRYEKDFLTHKQIECKNRRLFMRMKKRRLEKWDSM